MEKILFNNNLNNKPRITASYLKKKKRINLKFQIDSFLVALNSKPPTLAGALHKSAPKTPQKLEIPLKGLLVFFWFLFSIRFIRSRGEKYTLNLDLSPGLKDHHRVELKISVNVCMFMCLCVYICLYVYVFMCFYMFICLFVYVFLYVYMFMCLCVYMFICLCVYVFYMFCMIMCLCVFICFCVYTFIFLFVYMFIYVFMLLCLYVFICLYVYLSMCLYV